MPPVFITGKELQREKCLKYLDITFDVRNNRKGEGISQNNGCSTHISKDPRHILSVINYGFGLVTLSADQLKRLEIIQNEAMKTILGCTKDNSAKAMRYIVCTC